MLFSHQLKQYRTRIVMKWPKPTVQLSHWKMHQWVSTHMRFATSTSAANQPLMHVPACMPAALLYQTRWKHPLRFALLRVLNVLIISVTVGLMSRLLFVSVCAGLTMGASCWPLLRTSEHMDTGLCQKADTFPPCPHSERQAKIFKCFHSMPHFCMHPTAMWLRTADLCTLSWKVCISPLDRTGLASVSACIRCSWWQLYHWYKLSSPVEIEVESET